MASAVFGVYRRWLRCGPGYRGYLDGYRARDAWPRESFAKYQDARLGELLAAAANRIPYYRDTWNERQKTAARDGRLSELPLLDKAAVRQSPHAFAREDMRPLPRFEFRTSGSSGTPVLTLWSAREARDARALREVRSAGWAGVSFDETRATFGGRMIVSKAESDGPFHRYNPADKQVYLSAYHVSRRNAARYVDALWRHEVKWLNGFPVAFHLLARHILDDGLRVPPLKAVVTTSEKLTPDMRAVMEEAYGCKVFEEYGTVENAVFASECPHGRLHVSPDAGFVEILRPDGSICGPGEPGEVVTTGFIRQYQPFIRYRLGDVATWDPQPCTCGRQMPVFQEVVGRVEDVIVSPDGRQMVRFHGVFAGQPNIVEGQVIQDALDRIRVRVVPTAAFSAVDRDDLIRRVHQRLGDVQVLVEAVTEIPRAASGKFQGVISLIRPGQSPSA